MGLVANGFDGKLRAGTKKKAYATCGRLAEALAGLKAADRVSPGVYRFDREGKGPCFVIWDEDGKGTVTVTGIDAAALRVVDRKSTRLNSSHNPASRMPSSA
jgi:hypothetical protein